MRGKIPQKKPEATADDKLRYTKSKIKALEKEVGNLKDRVATLEKQVVSLIPKIKKIEPTEDQEREDLLKRVHPRYFKGNEDE